MPVRSPAQDVIQAVPTDKEALEAFETAFARVPANTTFCLSAPDTDPVELPETLYRTLRDAAHILLQGSAVAISPLRRRLSTTEAGDLLGVSRQYLTRLIDEGKIPCDRTGRHRRLMLSDVLEYKRHRDETRGIFTDNFTAGLAEAGYYD